MNRPLCERVAEPLLNLHGKTTPPLATIMLGIAGASGVVYGVSTDHRDLAWASLVVTVVAWYGFLLCGCYRLVHNQSAAR